MKTIEGKVTVGIQGTDGQTKEFIKPVSYPEYESADDILTVLSGATKETLDDFLGALNYGFNLKARAKVTAQIKAENAGPEVAINRAVKQIVANAAKFGKTVSEETARARVLANLELFGIE